VKQSTAQQFCEAEGCSNKATIIHGDTPLCGKHAVQRLEEEIAAAKLNR
jgi:hypothetical protein